MSEVIAMVKGGDAWLISFCDGVCADTHTVCSECNVANVIEDVDPEYLSEDEIARLPYCTADMLSYRQCDGCVADDAPFTDMRKRAATSATPCVVCADATQYAIPDSVGMAHIVRRGTGVVCGAVFPYGQVADDDQGRAVCPDCVRSVWWPERKPEVTTVMPYPNGEEGRDFVVNSRPDSDGFVPTVWFAFGQYSLAVRYDGYGIAVDITPTDDGLTDLAQCETRALAD